MILSLPIGLEQMPDNFCVIPWIHAATKTNGDARVCCLMSNHESGGLTGHNWAVDDAQTILNSDIHKKIRLQLLSDEQPVECNTCWVKERSGGGSRRKFSNRVFSHYTLTTAQEQTHIDGTIDATPEYWDIRFGNLCNLKCVMCGPQSSSMWYKDWAKVYDTDHFTDSGKTIYFDDKHQLDQTYNWWQSPAFWDALQENLHSIKHIYLVGGEPTIIEQHYEFLQMLVDAGVSKNITLEYDTNLTNVHTRALDLWTNFEKLFLRLSVDDYGEQNDYIRYPSKWNIIERNVSTLRNSIPDLRLEVSLTWQVLNAFTFIELLNFFKNDEVSIRILSSPEFLDCAWLPTTAKQDLITLYKKHNVPDHLINYLQDTINDYDDQLHQQFLSFCDKLDTIRNTNWRTVFVDLTKYI